MQEQPYLARRRSFIFLILQFQCFNIRYELAEECENIELMASQGKVDQEELACYDIKVRSATKGPAKQNSTKKSHGGRHQPKQGQPREGQPSKIEQRKAIDLATATKSESTTKEPAKRNPVKKNHGRQQQPKRGSTKKRPPEGTPSTIAMGDSALKPSQPNRGQPSKNQEVKVNRAAAISG